MRIEKYKRIQAGRWQRNAHRRFTDKEGKRERGPKRSKHPGCKALSARANPQQTHLTAFDNALLPTETNSTARSFYTSSSLDIFQSHSGGIGTCLIAPTEITTGTAEPFYVQVPILLPQGSAGAEAVSASSALMTTGMTRRWLTINSAYDSGTIQSTGTATVAIDFPTYIQTPVAGVHLDSISYDETVDYTACLNHWAESTKKQHFQARIRDNMRGPYFIANHRGRQIRGYDSATLFKDVSKAELVALSHLKRTLSAQQWRRYLQYGFVTVQGKSGLQYQIRRSPRGGVVAFYRSDVIAYLCIHGHRSLPPTDRVLTKKLIIECDEERIWKDANISIANSAYRSWLPYGQKPTAADLVVAARLGDSLSRGLIHLNN